ncbi:ankyrin-1-like [Chelonus insularis]|uniref:ankyrin-1-like n=1 Tax=Chelonus insularis TaxID=460826 RepID=UPI00158AB9F4|nr:ankyrin-1-like [Chelonus insularis]
MSHRGFLGDRSVENSWIPLFKSCKSGDVAAVKFLLENGANPDATKPHGQTALHFVSSYKSEKNLQILQLLIEHNADIEAVDKRGQTPLFEACICENFEAVECLLKNNANPNARDESGSTVLHRSCLMESETTCQIIQLLLKYNADVNAVCDIGHSPLFGACQFGGFAIIKILLENNANPNIVDQDGETPLHRIGYYESRTTRQIIELLLKYKADAEAVNKRGQTPLFEACRSGDIAAVECLLENCANPNVADRNGQTPLHHICLRECKTNLQIMQLLLKHDENFEAVIEKHAIVNVADRDYGAIRHNLYLKECRRIIQIIQLLLKHNANIEAVDEEGHTPLFVACNSQNIVAVKVLLTYGANIHIFDKRNQSPLPCAVDKMLTTSPVNLPIHTVIQMLVSHSIKLKTAGLNLNECDFVTMNGAKYSAINGLKFNTVLDDALDTLDTMCEEEIKRMKMENIGINDMCFHELLTQHMHRIGILMENQKIQEILKPSDYDEKFPLYMGIVRFRLRKAQCRYERYKLQKSAGEHFRSNIKPELLPECIDEVLSYLTTIDLKTFIRTFEPSKGE